ncbi:Hypothetical predicted protein [Cloeon dipterum]|uniref:Uncharacterized protein n=1 Tax=Cloeon dipterum TaxID=197152 RepID=A0A8S1CDF8_9INSE|nr:Hypothetical predicted protein [Cloeon dipterum]
MEMVVATPKKPNMVNGIKDDSFAGKIYRKIRNRKAQSQSNPDSSPPSFTIRRIRTIHPDGTDTITEEYVES